MTTPGIDAESLRSALAGAEDGKLGRIVGMLDGLLDRGAADRLLEPIRPRLGALRPARPLRFPRLLAMPLEGALVASDAWRGAPDEIPRSALTPLAEAMAASLGEAAEEIEVAALGHTADDAALVGRLGGRLWPLAAGVALPVPAGWQAAGLPRASAAPILALSAMLWRHGAALWTARLAGPEGPPAWLLKDVLGRVAPGGGAALMAALRLLLRHAAAPERVVGVAVALRPEIAAAAEAARAAEVAQRAAAQPARG